MPISTVTPLVPVLTTFKEYASRMESEPTYYTRDYVMSRCRETIQSNDDNYYRFRTNRFTHRIDDVLPMAEKMRLVSAFGVMVASYIRDDDVDSMYNLVNSEQFRFVRDGMRTDWSASGVPP